MELHEGCRKERIGWSRRRRLGSQVQSSVCLLVSIRINKRKRAYGKASLLAVLHFLAEGDARAALLRLTVPVKKFENYCIHFEAAAVSLVSEAALMLVTAAEEGQLGH